MLSIIVGTVLMSGGSVLLIIVFNPEAWRAYFYRSRHCSRAAKRRAARAADPYIAAEDWFREWRKQYPALMEETRAMSVLRGR